MELDLDGINDGKAIGDSQRVILVAGGHDNEEDKPKQHGIEKGPKD